ncbi:N-methyl-L-tryptophan oxidase [Phragmitibacter flavus]|uniref:N-methyl-L-tryptophan oxidase n=1 Tax=Phragmitibacter flavus TaxID=2576071 RepID=A0A5R8KKP6_9BACT|nr:N-methyl-L-tryptophan oxidase [Phragmitibacter flavus]TLD72827.1 N-methyl-L-tryptophan oxidase [Phragmitibacter flavus]
MSTSFDVIIAGIGAMGSATLRHLSAQGLRVAGIDPFPPGHDQGSSHGDTRIIRKAYFLHPDYVPLLHRSYHLWRKLETEIQQSLLHLTGLLCIGEEGSSFMTGLQRCFDVNQLPHERLTAAETRARYPAFNIPDNHLVYFDPEGGYLRPEACIRAQTQLATQHGATLFTGERLLTWEPDGTGVRLTTNQRVLTAQKLILTTGAWVTPEFAKLGIPLKVRRKVLFWHQLNDPATFTNTPVWIWKSQGSDFYGFPTLDNTTMKSAEDSGGTYLDQPEDRDFNIHPDDDANLTPFLARAFPNKIGPVQHGKTCLYTDAADKNFLIGFHPEHPQVLLASCCSGHGFKLSIAIGEILGNAITTDQIAPEAAFLSLSSKEGGHSCPPQS